MKKSFLFTPGPTPLPPEVLAALSLPLLHHRSEDFKEIFRSVQKPLQKLFGTQEPVLTLTASGTAGMEACIRSVLNSKDSVLVVNAGKFGERFGKISKSYGIATEEVSLEWGQALQISQLEKSLKKTHTALLIQYSETSTAALHPLPEVAAWLQKNRPDVFLFVDAITAIGAMPFEMDRWKVDAAITGSQKGLMLPPGLNFVALSPRARARRKLCDLPGYYLDLEREFEALAKNQTAFTPAISLIVALKASLQMLEAEGFAKVFERHEKLANATRKAAEAMGLRLATSSPSVACTSILFPTDVDGKALLKSIKDKWGFHIAGAQDKWEGKVARISHLGYYSPFDLMNALSAFGRELERKTKGISTAKGLETFMTAFDL